MNGYIDLHCHWVPAIDDGVATPDDGVELLKKLHAIGFTTVIATPHMRPGLFANARENIVAAYEAMLPRVSKEADMPAVGLSCEHFLDDIVFARVMADEAVPYPGKRAILLEFPSDNLPVRLADRLFDIRRRGLRPVIAHPERYASIWRNLDVADDLVERGMPLLLDVAALAGKYGRSARKAAEKLLEMGAYYAACSDAHKPSDVDEVHEGIRRLKVMVGVEEATFLLRDGPQRILDGKVDL